MQDNSTSREEEYLNIRILFLKAFLFFTLVIVSTLSWNLVNKNDQISALGRQESLFISAENTDIKNALSIFASEGFSQAIYNDSNLNIAFTYPKESVTPSTESSFISLQFLKNPLLRSYLSRLKTDTLPEKTDEYVFIRNYWSDFFSKKGVITEVGPQEGSRITFFSMNISTNVFGVTDTQIQEKISIYSIKNGTSIFTMAVISPEIIVLNDSTISTIQNILESAQEGEIPAFANEVIPNISKLNKYELATQLATVKLHAQQCISIAVDMPETLPETTKKTYKTCLPINGTGFFVGNSGNILTSAQFASPNPYDVLLDAIQAKNDGGLIKAIAADVVVAMNKKEPYLNTGNSEVQREIIDNTNKLLLYGLSQKTIFPTVESSTFYVQQSQPFSYNESGVLQNEDSFAKAEKLASKVSQSLYEYAFTQTKNKQDGKAIEPFALNQPDIALLKVTVLSEPPALVPPLLPIIGIGSSVSIIGFQEDQSSPIAQIKNTTLSEQAQSVSGFSLYKTTSVLDSSLIGGPIITKNGDFSGMSTYTIEGNTKVYNGILSTDVIQRFLSENGITDQQNTTIATFSNALDNISKGYYSWAKDDLARVARIYPTASIFTNPLENYASEQITAGNDNTPIYSILGLSIHRGDVPVLAVGTISLLVIAIIAIILQRQTVTTPQQPQRPVRQKRRSTTVLNPYFPNFAK